MLITAARKGSIPAAREILDRVEGKCALQNQITERDDQASRLMYFDALLIDAEERRKDEALAADTMDALPSDEVSS
jgi:hypothetical protein